MPLPPLQPEISSDIRISGDVTIHPDAAIASGVILQAAPNSSIVIGEGACLGLGVIISAYEGEIAIERGATLGREVLVVGCSHIGHNACIGAATTIISVSVEAQSVIPPGSLLGDTSRQVSQQVEEEQIPTEFKSSTQTQTPQSTTTARDEVTDVNVDSNGSSQPTAPATSINRETTPDKTATEPQTEEVTTVEFTNEDPWDDEQENASSPPSIVGKMYVNQLLVTLFPHGQSLNHKNQGNNSQK